MSPLRRLFSPHDEPIMVDIKLMAGEWAFPDVEFITN